MVGKKNRFLVQGKRDGFPVVFDINLDQNGAQNRLQYLMDGLFLDNATDVLTVQLVTYNGEFQNIYEHHIRCQIFHHQELFL